MMLLLKLAIPFLFSGPDSSKTAGKVDHCRDVVGVCRNNDYYSAEYIFDKQIYDQGCDTLNQVIFWQTVMNLSSDSCVVNVAGTRQIVAILSNKEWNAKPDSAKELYRQRVRDRFYLSDSARVLITTGKSYFYCFENAYPNIDNGIKSFISNETDPWYAQAILLIESPNKLQKSNVGAYGPFQLMKPVARMFGLRVNKKVDERANFERAAFAASSLIKKVCIPKTKEMLDSLGITYHEQELWFRLMVMHCYHAGSGNVKAALEVIKPEKGGMELIQKLWATEAKGFRTASQNYSQLVLAAMLEMNKRVGLSTPLASN